MGAPARAIQVIFCGDFVCEYAGDLITSEEEDHRESDQYIFALDHFLGAAAPLCLDARLAGGVGRFVNHSDAPNLVLQPVFTPASGAGHEAFYRVALFAARDIPPTEELLFNYGDQYIMDPPES